MLQKIKIFYHFFACCPEYKLWLDEQLGLVRDSGLSKLSLVDICISYTDNIYIDKVEDYINKNFSDVVGSIKIIPKRNNRFHEGVTLDEIYKFSCKNDGYKILYFHSKGISRISCNPKIAFDENKFPFESVYNIRSYTQKLCIKNHKRCIKELDKYDVTGVGLRLYPLLYFEINFWWANSSYIKKLQPPLNEDRYAANIRWDMFGRFTAWRVQRAKKGNNFCLYSLGRAANEFWICNNTVLSDGTIVSKTPKIKLSTMFYDRRISFVESKRIIKDLVFYLLRSNSGHTILN